MIGFSREALYRTDNTCEFAMIFKVFAKAELETLFELLSINHLIGPVQKGTNTSGNPLVDFDYLYDFKDLFLDYPTTHHSLKKFFLPYSEKLCAFKLDGTSWDKQVDLNVSLPHVFFGVHACDINALNKLDKVLSKGPYPDPYYTTKRQNMFIIGFNCKTPASACFCRSMGADTVLHGFEMFLTDLGDRYFAEIHTSKAFNLVQQIEAREPAEVDHRKYLEFVNRKNRGFIAQVDTTDLTKILDMEFQSEVWNDWGEKCLACGTCANVCPTCYCYGVEENVALDLQSAVKTRRLYSCNLIDFATVAGGHNFRKDRHVRLKYRYYHKHRGFVEAFEESLCVGCGRCGQNCLAEITVPEVIDSVRSGKKIK